MLGQIAHEGFWWAAAACAVVAFVSAVFPWVNAEIFVLALPSIAGNAGRLAALVAVVTVGQMAGKYVIFAAARRGLTTPPRRAAALMDRWRARLTGSAAQALSLIAFSSTVGLPPFYVVSMIAGAVNLRADWFLAAGAAGRLVRFLALAFVPQAVLQAL